MGARINRGGDDVHGEVSFINEASGVGGPADTFRVVIGVLGLWWDACTRTRVVAVSVQINFLGLSSCSHAYVWIWLARTAPSTIPRPRNSRSRERMALFQRFTFHMLPIFIFFFECGHDEMNNDDGVYYFLDLRAAWPI